MSNSWQLVQDQATLATLKRHGKMHVSTAQLADGAIWVLEPNGWGVVRAREGDTEIARITRRSALGRRWDVTGTGFAYELVNPPRPRFWRVQVGGSPLAELRGSLLSYNKLRIESALAVPTVVILLGWHVVTRPWEQAAAPKGLVPVAIQR